MYVCEDTRITKHMHIFQLLTFQLLTSTVLAATAVPRSSPDAASLIVPQAPTKKVFAAASAAAFPILQLPAEDVTESPAAVATAVPTAVPNLLVGEPSSSSNHAGQERSGIKITLLTIFP